MKKIRNYFWADALKDIYTEKITVEQHIKGVIEEFEKIGGEYATILPELRAIDEALSNGTTIKQGKKKRDAAEAILHLFCDIFTKKIDAIYRAAKTIKTENPDGSFSISTALMEEEKERIENWAWAYWELHYAWNRLMNGEPYHDFKPRWDRISIMREEMETV